MQPFELEPPIDRAHHTSRYNCQRGAQPASLHGRPSCDQLGVASSPGVGASRESRRRCCLSCWTQLLALAPIDPVPEPNCGSMVFSDTTSLKSTGNPHGHFAAGASALIPAC